MFVVLSVKIPAGSGRLIFIMNELDRFIKEFRNWESGDLILRFIYFILWAGFILFLSWLARKGINRTIENNTFRYRARKFTRLSGYVLILFLGIITFTGHAQNFAIAIGIISAGIAFALQEVLLSIAGWIAIFISNIYKPGDRIEMNGIKGDVIDIGVSRTTLMEIGEWVNSDNYSGRIVQVSNAFVFKGPVRNYSTDFPFVWDEINLPFKYGTDIQLVNQVILGCARNLLEEYANYAKTYWKQMVRKYMIEDAHVEPTLTCTLTDNCIEFNLRYVVDYKKRRITKDKLYAAIYDAIQQSGGKIVLASATFELVGIPDLRLDTNTNKGKTGQGPVG